MLVVPAWQEEQWGRDNQERGELEPKLLSKINQTRAVCPRLLGSPCGRGLSDWQAGAQPAVELHSL